MNLACSSFFTLTKEAWRAVRGYLKTNPTPCRSPLVRGATRGRGLRKMLILVSVRSLCLSAFGLAPLLLSHILLPMLSSLASITRSDRTISDLL